VALEATAGTPRANARSDTVSVIDVDACVEAAAVPVGRGPLGIGLDPSGTRAYVANASENRIVVIDTATRAVTGSLAVGKLPVAFGPFIGPLANDCPRAAVVCNDADPGTVDACTLDGGCLYTPLAGIEAVAADLSALDALVRAARAGDLGSPETATMLGRLVTNARGELTPGAGALRKRLLRISREMGGFTRALGRGLRRGRVRCGIGLRLLDIARGTRADARRLAGRP
jgi:YVTN family beta-propeller protein